MTRRYLNGKQFGELTVVGYDGRFRICSCSCGNTTRVHVANLKRQTSCGCRQHPIQHGCARKHVEALEYRIWVGIKTRCTNPNCRAYYRYGGRGIKVHQEWAASFEAFLRDVGPRPSRKYTIDRIDNDGDYAPGNVRWATRAEQARNTSKTRLVTFNGSTRCLRDWATVLGINYRTLRQRFEYGWTSERAFTTPVQVHAS